jgi:hypothetical protein
MASRHLSCPACRIRVRADAPAIAVLENRCPLCGAALSAVSSAALVVGFRSFALDELSEQKSSDQADRSGNPDDLVGGGKLPRRMKPWTPTVGRTTAAASLAKSR